MPSWRRHDGGPAVPGRPARPLSVLLLGDVMLGRRVAARLREAPPAWVWGDTLDLIHAADVRFANLECVLSERGDPWRPEAKPFHFRTAPRHVASLTAARLDAVSLANNHAYDFGPEALLETIDVLEAAGISHAGAGADDERAYAPLFLERAGVRIGLVAYTDNEPAWAAGPGRPGTAFARSVRRDPLGRRVLATVREARRRADLVVVSAHWGGNYGSEPRRRHRAFGRALVAAGADVVHGHSAHVCRGVRWRRGRPILFATGDAVHDYEAVPDERNDHAFAAQVDVEGGRPARLRLHPLLLRDERVRRATGEDRDLLVARIEALCARERTPTRWDPATASLVLEAR